MWYVKIWDSQRIRKKFQLSRRKNEISIFLISFEMDIHTHISIPTTFISHRFSSPTQTLSSSSFHSYFPFKFVVCSKRDDQSQTNADNNGIFLQLLFLFFTSASILQENLIHAFFSFMIYEKHFFIFIWSLFIFYESIQKYMNYTFNIIIVIKVLYFSKIL